MFNGVQLNTQGAYDFYRKFIYNIEFQNILRQHGFSVKGSVAPKSWEAFAAILTGDQGKQGYGSDLEHFEVKSAVHGSGFEYQYHLNGGKTKLSDDMVVNHVFISYSEDYGDIEVRVLKGEQLRPFFETWLPGLIANYEGENKKQRYRKNIPNGFVLANGEIILRTLGGEFAEL